MNITMSGTSNNDQFKSVTWNLVARQNHGPEIPCSPALILARKLAANAIDTRGALPCLGLFSISELRRELSEFDVQWNVSEAW
jgi:hypothetical protein